MSIDHVQVRPYTREAVHLAYSYASISPETMKELLADINTKEELSREAY